MTASNQPPWIAAARRYIGLRELPGAPTAPVIAGWLTRLHAWWSDDATPWCGTFVAAMMQEAGIPSATNWFRARAWLEWGTPLPVPVPGCVVVFERPGGGHVGFVVGKDARGRLMILGGNQGDAVSIAPFDAARALGYRWPSEIQLMPARLPVLAAKGMASSKNEA